MNQGRPIPLLGTQREGHLVIATLQRPPANLIDRTLAAAIRSLCERLSEEENVRLLLITTDAETFCRGTDPFLLEEARTARSMAESASILGGYSCASSVASLPFPVIAAIEGEAFDQGLELALAADLRVAAENARFRLGQLTEGLIPWDGGTQRLPRVVGPAQATDLILTGRTLDAPEAERIGLLNRLAPPGQAMAVARERAEQILAGGPIAARYAKEAVNSGMDMTLDQGILLETALTMVLQTTADRTEGIRSFLERRRPQYKGE